MYRTAVSSFISKLDCRLFLWPKEREPHIMIMYPPCIISKVVAHGRGEEMEKNDKWLCQPDPGDTILYLT